MKVLSFPIKVTSEKAMEMAKKSNGFIFRLFTKVKNDNLHVKTLYIENKIITFNITRKPNIIDQLLKRNPKGNRSKIRMIANGSTCGVAYYDGKGTEPGEADVDDEHVQMSDYPDDMFVTRGNALARRILRRRVGGSLTLDVDNITSVFRPYHVVFFGEPEEGKKVYYIPIAADGCSVNKTF